MKTEELHVDVMLVDAAPEGVGRTEATGEAAPRSTAAVKLPPDARPPLKATLGASVVILSSESFAGTSRSESMTSRQARATPRERAMSSVTVAEESDSESPPFHICVPPVDSRDEA